MNFKEVGKFFNERRNLSCQTAQRWTTGTKGRPGETRTDICAATEATGLTTLLDLCTELGLVLFCFFFLLKIEIMPTGMISGLEKPHVGIASVSGPRICSWR